MASEARIFGALRRGPWIVPAAALVIGLAAALVTWDRDDDAIAETTLVASAAPGGARPAAALAETLAPLVESQVTLDNVIGNLRLDLRADDLRDSVSTQVGDARIVIRAEDPDGQRAVRIAQEIALVFSQLVRERLAPTAGSGASVTIFDPARVVERTSRSPVPFALGGAAAGAVLGWLLLVLLRRAAAHPADPASVDALRARESAAVERHAALASRTRELDERERVLAERVAAVTQRELAVARTAATPSAIRDVPAGAVGLPPATPAPVAPPPPPAAVEPALPPAPPPPPAAAEPPPAPAAAGAFSLPRLEHLVAAARGDHPQERLEEWLYYLLFLRDHADPEGRLPRTFDGLVADVFDDVLSRS